MDLDLLKKLVKLANNNPNENEANSAARRVCKMIEENKFDFRAIAVDNEAGTLLEYATKWQQQQNSWNDITYTQ